MRITGGGIVASAVPWSERKTVTDWHRYVLWEKPAALRAWEWRAVLIRLWRVLNRYMVQVDGEWVEQLPADVQPPHRLHYRFNNNKTKIIMEANFHGADLDIEDAARLALYIRNSLNTANELPPIIGYENGGPIYDEARSYTTAQVQNAMRSHITIAGGTWEESRQLTLAYLEANAEDWGTQ